MGVKSDLETASGALQSAVDQAEAALDQLIAAGEEALKQTKDKVLSTTIGEAIEAGKAALARFTTD